MKKTSVLFLFFSFSIYCFAQENHLAGARSLALSNASVSFSDVWGTFHNQAGLAGMEHFSGGVFYGSRFLIDELSLAAASLALPIKSGTFGLSFSQFGKGTFKEHRIGLAFAKSLSPKIQAAIQLDYLSKIMPENERAKGFATFEAGVIYAVNRNIVLGSHVFNPIRGGIETPNGKQKMPAIFRIGGHYQFNEMVLVAMETQKAGENPFMVKTGIEFFAVENLALRFGFSGRPVQYTAGIGYRFGKIITDIAFSYHGNLGLTPSVSIQFEL